jgi:DNA-binding CsgD family transcriptional regulator
MNTTLFNDEANKIWQKAASSSIPEQLQIKADFYNKLFNFFQVGDYYYAIFNLSTLELELVSNEVTKVTGYEPSEFTVASMMDKIHEDDRPWFLNFENKIRLFLATLPPDKLMKYKARYDFRLKRKDGTSMRVLHQSMVIEHDDEGQILRTMAVHTDISHLKAEGRPILSIIGLDGEPSYIDVDVDKIFTVSKEFLSKREKQILQLIIEGKVSKEISEMLHISKQTVDSHRNNMIAKSGLKNTSQLIAKAIREGWI